MASSYLAHMRRYIWLGKMPWEDVNAAFWGRFHVPTCLEDVLSVAMAFLSGSAV